MEEFRNIGIIGRLNSNKVIETIKRLSRYLIDEGYHVILDDRIAEVMPGHAMQVSNVNLLGEISDLVIVVGGDGSLLGAARALARYNTPVLGINRGRLGFLTDISPDDDMCDAVQAVLNGEYISELRFLLDAEVKRDGNPIATASALNDVVLHPGKATRMIGFDLWIEGQYVYNQRSDGLIVSTPTGSTAYALSGGGPIMHPKLDALVLVPMFPHTLSSRPIVVDGKSEIKIVIDPQQQIYPTISCDGQTDITCAPGDTITIRKKAHKLKLIHPKGHNFYEICRTKLGWSSNLGD
ncbi:NAD(+) kinase [Venatoribacter cucullus]|uniref:NAD kinase n=1 Tax=Venatoribacter cucullus TaxID=2661630 RepID=A0A9X7YNV6_9GAMM|nr:NAD(+) kinase [Venatoribacter cucullus]QQD21874.1 NAD(+) kinase [Oceanospirillaceae bacterium ASx5O]QQD24568.1 NAD(+) kinase [Venatoribacter cucullus]